MVETALDYFLVSEKVEDIQHFMPELAKVFKVGKVYIGGVFRFMGCAVNHTLSHVKWKFGNYLIAPEKPHGHLEDLLCRVAQILGLL